MYRFRMALRLYLPLAVAVLAFATLSGCSVNPATGERQLSLISESQEIELGRNAAAQAEQSLGLVDDPALQRYVSDLGLALAATSERPGLPWRFAVIDDPAPNAFALPGGFIYVTRGMLNLMNSEAELASVLGHEIAHVTARHSVAQISRSQLAQIGLGVGAILYPEYRSLTDLAGTGLQVLLLKYGRDAEREADELGFRYALDNDYDVSEMADVFRALQRSSELAGRSSLPGWLSTHPGEEERIEAVRARVAALPGGTANRRVGRAEFLAKIDGLVWGDNPRHGYFEGGYFLHPEMAFKFPVPADWQTRNSTSAVMALSPANDAKLQLTLASGTPEQAAAEFFNQQGVQRGPGGRDTINGIAAVVHQFRAGTSQGNVAGYVAHYRVGERTLALTVFTPEARFGGYDRGFRGIVSGFAPVTDPAVLNVQPARIDIHRLGSAMSLARFAETDDSNVPLAQLALINDIADPNARLPAGTTIKRVIGNVR